MLGQVLRPYCRAVGRQKDRGQAARDDRALCMTADENRRPKAEWPPTLNDRVNDHRTMAVKTE